MIHDLEGRGQRLSSTGVSEKNLKGYEAPSMLLAVVIWLEGVPAVHAGSSRRRLALVGLGGYRNAR